MMVGVTIGLIVVAAATMLTSTQLGENRRLLLETQLQQDLRASADVITRELRRASYTPAAFQQIWYANRASPAASNSFGPMTPASGVGLTEFEFAYLRRPGDQGPYGFKKDANILRTEFAGSWHQLTDERVMKITAFNVNLSDPETVKLPCPALCPGGTDSCWPEIQMRTARITITGQSVADPTMSRTLTTQVRVRNDYVKFNGDTVCPE